MFIKYLHSLQVLGSNPAKTSYFHPVLQEKAPPKKTLRILTAVIEGMKYWSQFKDKIPMMFEIFGE